MRLTMRSSRCVHAALAAVAALAVFSSACAQSIGVTSLSIGDPLGKPPTAAERVLRVGIDLQAGELVTTGAEDRCHLLFLDGTARLRSDGE